MAHAAFRTFDAHRRQVVRTHRKLALTGAPQIGPDGLITIRPRRRGLAFPWRGVFVIFAAALLLKAVLLAQLGSVTYGERVAALRDGSVVERAGAWVMTPDWASLALADSLRPYLG